MYVPNPIYKHTHTHTHTHIHTLLKWHTHIHPASVFLFSVEPPVYSIRGFGKVFIWNSPNSCIWQLNSLWSFPAYFLVGNMKWKQRLYRNIHRLPLYIPSNMQHVSALRFVSRPRSAQAASSILMQHGCVCSLDTFCDTINDPQNPQYHSIA